MVWSEKPYLVNRGAQKNFAEFAKDIAGAWDTDNKQFNEIYFKTLVAKKIVFDRTTKIVQERDWYEAGGYRAQHVVLAIGLLASAIASMGKSANFLAIWNMQGLSPSFERALAQAADAAHAVLMNPGEGYRNISEWAKQPKCWLALKQTEVAWDNEWLEGLIDKEQADELQREGARDQKELNGIEAQTAVVEAGADFWKDVLDWCVKEDEASEKERGILKTATGIPAKIPTDKQSIILVEMMRRLRKGGCPYRLKRSNHRRRV